jgi:hypothetical protein
MSVANVTVQPCGSAMDISATQLPTHMPSKLPTSIYVDWRRDVLPQILDAKDPILWKYVY